MALPQQTDAAAPPVASGSETTLIRCSQCKTFKRPTSYPLRLVNLEPYHVCLTHNWYWTPAKRAQNWAPSETKSIEQVASEAGQLLEGTPAAQTSWMLDGDDRDLAAFSSRIAAAGDWKSTEVNTRQRKKETATDAQPSPMFAYNLVPRDSSRSDAGGFRLTFYVHTGTGKVTVTMKPDGKAAVAASPWSRPKRWKKKGSRSASEGAAEIPPPVPAAESAIYDDGGVLASQGFDHAEASSFAAALEAAAAAVGASENNLPPQSDPYAIMDHHALASATGYSDRDAMPPPPLPATRPAKRARRVEPQLVSPMPTYSNDAINTSTNPAFAAAAVPDWTRFLSFPTLALPNGDIPIDPSLTNPPQNGSSSIHRSRKQPLSPRKRTSHGSPPPTNRPLTLAEMLSSSLFEPPDLDLPERTTSVAGSGTQYLHPSRQEPTRESGTTAAVVGQDAATSSAAAALATQELVSALTTLRDGIYARTTGQSPAAAAVASTPATTIPPESPANGDEREEEGYYEDSIPDTSSEEEDDEEDAGGDASDMSSFFESSDEEGGSGGGDNWLEGFAAQQMGLQTHSAPDRASPNRNSSTNYDRASRRGTAHRVGDRLHAHEVDELDDRDPPQNRTPSSAFATPSEEIDELDSQAGSGADA